MIAKYPAKCRYCGKSIKVGEDEYDYENKSSYHVACFESQDRSPGAEAIELADRLLFCAHDDGSIRAMAGQWVTMRGVREADRSQADQRQVGSPASREQNRNLFS